VDEDKEISEGVQENTAVDEVLGYSGGSDNKVVKTDDLLVNDLNEFASLEIGEPEIFVDNEIADSVELNKGPGIENEGSSGDTANFGTVNVYPPPPPVPPPKPSVASANTRRPLSGSSNAVRIGSSRRGAAWPIVSTRTSPTGSRPSSPRSHGESEGYNSADEQNPCYVSSYDDFERERQFYIDIRRATGLEVKIYWQMGIVSFVLLLIKFMGIQNCTI
jgi:OTU domain-containing protein 5